MVLIFSSKLIAFLVCIQQINSYKVPETHIIASQLGQRDGCETDPNWQPTKPAWATQNTDQNLANWWQSTSSVSHSSFVNELGKNFGGHLNGFECGIGAYSTCVAPGCSDYDDNNDPAWSYLALLSVVNLNQFYNSIFLGITNGQLDYQALTNDIANRFFPWKEPEFILGDAAFWIVAIITAIFAVPAMLAGPELVVAAVALGAFAAAGVQQVTDSLEPGVISSQLLKSEGLAKLNQFAADIGSTSRENVEKWANSTMHGDEDALGKSIVDYLNGGAFIDPDLPTNTEIEAFYKKQMVSRVVNAQWKKQKVFITFYKTDNPNDLSGPNTTRYYSADDGGVYYLYRYTELGILEGYLDKPWGLDYLNGSTYGIKGNDITEASARAYRAGQFNYTEEMAKSRILESMSSNGTLTPFKDGAAWEGTWTIPVCDMGAYNWNSQFLDRNGSRYGMLPCCCGPNCQETKNFTEAANLHGFQTLLRGCKNQLKDTPLSYNDIDYGFGWKKSLPLAWATWSKGQRAGIAMGIIFAANISFFALTGLVVACAGG